MNNIYSLHKKDTSCAFSGSVSILHANLKEVNVHKKITTPIVLMLFLAGAVFPVYGYDSGDFQIWNSNVQDLKIGKATKFTMEEEFRYGENASEFFYQHYDWGFAWAFDKRLEIALGYRLVYEKVRRKWMEADEPYTNITVKLDLWKFKFEDRNRIEYRHFRFADDQARYRNKFALKYPFDFKGMKIAPYTSDEIFISSNGRGFNQNRFQSGLEIELTKYVKFDISYMAQQIRGKGNKWYTANVLWLKNKISF
jgi:hypothetical protein